MLSSHVCDMHELRFTDSFDNITIKRLGLYFNNKKIIYHDFLTPLRRGSHVKSYNTHRHPLAHILDT